MDLRATALAGLAIAATACSIDHSRPIGASCMVDRECAAGLVCTPRADGPPACAAPWEGGLPDASSAVDAADVVDAGDAVDAADAADAADAGDAAESIDVVDAEDASDAPDAVDASDADDAGDAGDADDAAGG